MNFQVANNYGEKIYHARKSKKMSRVELGELVDLHQTSVKKYEDGNIKNPSVEKLASFAKVLDIPLLELLHFESTDNDRAIYNEIPFYVDQIYSSFNQAIKGLKKQIYMKMIFMNSSINTYSRIQKVLFILI